MTSPLSLLAAGVGAVVLAIAGCGSDDVEPAHVARAADTTRAEQSARVDWRVTTRGFGLPSKLTLAGRGTTALDDARMDLRFDVAPLLRLTGTRAPGRSADVVVRGRDLYVRPPRGFELPGGRRWMTLDLVKTLSAAGADAAGLGEVMTLDPGAQIDVLRSAEGVEEVGPATVGGARTTHYRGRISLSDFAEGLPEGRRERAERAIEQFAAETGGDEAQPFEVWIDDRDRVRRMTQTAQVPRQEGVPSGEVAIAMELSEFGARVIADAPPAAETFDATGTVSEALRASR